MLNKSLFCYSIPMQITVLLNEKVANEIVGGLSQPSKMPGFAYGLPAKDCITGKKLVKIENSVCSKCYALRGHYRYSNVQKAHARRLLAIQNENWTNAMAYLLNVKSASFFRWHDSGDLQSLQHLEKIVNVCRLTPNTKHWLPTREYGIVASYVAKHGDFPSNLCVRLSAFKFEFPAPSGLAKRLNVQTSTVSKTSFTCPASKQENNCGLCRACWNTNETNICYKRH